MNEKLVVVRDGFELTLPGLLVRSDDTTPRDNHARNSADLFFVAFALVLEKVQNVLQSF